MNTAALNGRVWSSYYIRDGEKCGRELSLSKYSFLESTKLLKEGGQHLIPQMPNILTLKLPFSFREIRKRGGYCRNE